MGEAVNQTVTFKELYDRYYLPLYKYCYARLNGDSHAAEDCVQDSYTVFLEKTGKNEEISHPAAFLYRTADNFILRRKAENARALSKTEPFDGSERAPEVKDPEDFTQKVDFELCTQKLNEDLSVEEKELFSLRFLDDLSVSQISQRLDVSIPTVTMRLKRLRKKCKKTLVELFEERKGVSL